MAKWLNDYRGPLKVVLAGADEIVPMDLGRNLFNGYKGPKDLEIMPDAGHNDATSRPVDWWVGVSQFWKTNSGLRGPGLASPQP